MKFSAITIASLIAAVAAHPSCKPATYSCLPGAGGWQVCNTSGQWEFAGDCPPNTVCKFYPPSLSPYCVPPNFQIP